MYVALLLLSPNVDDGYLMFLIPQTVLPIATVCIQLALVEQQQQPVEVDGKRTQMAQFQASNACFHLHVMSQQQIIVTEHLTQNFVWCNPYST